MTVFQACSFIVIRFISFHFSQVAADYKSNTRKPAADAAHKNTQLSYICRPCQELTKMSCRLLHPIYVPLPVTLHSTQDQELGGWAEIHQPLPPPPRFLLQCTRGSTMLASCLYITYYMCILCLMSSQF